MINLKEQRESLGLTLKQVANKLNVSTQFVYMIEEGIKTVPEDKIEEWTKIYNTNKWDIVDTMIINAEYKTRLRMIDKYYG